MTTLLPLFCRKGLSLWKNCLTLCLARRAVLSHVPKRVPLYENMTLTLLLYAHLKHRNANLLFFSAGMCSQSNRVYARSQDSNMSLTSWFSQPCMIATLITHKLTWLEQVHVSNIARSRMWHNSNCLQWRSIPMYFKAKGYWGNCLRVAGKMHTWCSECTT
jgi:hypothetical protein